MVEYGVATANVHLITGLWDEATVTWTSFGGAFSGSIVKSFSTANPVVTFSLALRFFRWT